MAVLIQMESNWAEKTARLTLKANHSAWTMADQTGRTMARMMAVLIQMESNWAEKTARLTLKANHSA
eukprot:scaffold6860_cov73-Skeletonema_dohrnii-CCMP3373.AAC.1